jgi:hypothetical protein
MPNDGIQAAFEPAKAVATKLDADVYLHSATIDRDAASSFCVKVHSLENKRRNAVLILTTYGGDPDAAFIIARALKRSYSKLYVFVFGFCKSAGTLLVLAANEIVMSDDGELGPLDIQIGKDDEIFKRSSGLDINESIKFLKGLAAELFYREFIKLKAIGTLTTKTAAEIAQLLATGIIHPIAAQIDPLRIGESERSMRIARDYGRLLNPTFEKLEDLVTGYPSHGFVIDREQACEIFASVRPPVGAEAALEKALGDVARTPSDIIEFLTPQQTETPPPTNIDGSDTSKNENQDLPHGKSDSNGEALPATAAVLATPAGR